MPIPPRDHPEFPCFLKDGLQYEPPPLPAFLLKAQNMPRRQPSFLVQLVMPIVLAATIVATGVTLGFYLLFVI